MEDDHGSIQWDKVFQIKKTKLLKISNLDDKITLWKQNKINHKKTFKRSKEKQGVMIYLYKFIKSNQQSITIVKTIFKSVKIISKLNWPFQKISSLRTFRMKR
jgi:hypothetical protein